MVAEGKKVMQEDFVLLDAFKSKEHICDLGLCTVLMENKEFPWLFLVPMRNNIRQIHQLSELDQAQLMREINQACVIMDGLFSPEVLNVASIGNKTPQLHIHIIARSTNDSLWPEAVWGRPMRRLESDEIIARKKMIQSGFSNN